MNPRRGAILIYCIGLAAILVVLGYGFLRSTLADTTAGSASQRVLLAQSAARAAFMRASECIIADYTQATQAVNQGTNGIATVGPVTYLDGHWRAPFVSIRRPNELYAIDRNVVAERDDVSSENFILHPFVAWAGGSEGLTRHAWYSRVGAMVATGRGRYHEVGYHPASRPAPTGTTSQPLAVMRFTDFTAGIPERNEGLFLDADFHRIDTGNPVQDRVLARYRLRFANSIEDLQGHLLTNPYAEGDFDPRSPTAAYRVPPAWVSASEHAWYNLICAFSSAGNTTPLHYIHLFQGRGNTSNVDLSTAGGPVTFPMMFRRTHMEGAKQPYWGRFSNTIAKDEYAETDGIYLPATAAGGQPIPAVSSYNTPFIAHGFGPQISWVNQHQASLGHYGKWAGDPTWGGGTLGQEVANFVPTPFGRRLQKSANPPADWKWYEGRVDSPWYVNLLTAPPRTVHAMLMAYFPPTSLRVGVVEEFSLYVGKDARGHDIWGSVIATNSRPGAETQLRGRDLFTSASSPAFTYAPPSADGISPNYQKGDSRAAEVRYPGALWNANDDLGRLIDVNDVMPVGACSHTRRPFFWPIGAGGSLDEHYKSEEPALPDLPPWKTTPPPGWGVARSLPGQPGYDGKRDRVQVKTSTKTLPFSYWWDIAHAFTTTVGTVRAAWKQWPTSICDPYANMDAALHDPTLFDTIEEVDRLFLRQLGEDFDNPGNGTILPWVVYTPGYDNGKQEYRLGTSTPNNTIRTLKNAGSITEDQANVMERVLNDFRLSFFGASPQYSETFRPKDFSGDGKVHCSAYTRNLAASATDESNGVAWWKDDDGAGNGPVVDEWFSLTGCFFIGRSHYYRIFSRGELFDNLVQKTVADQTLETVLCVDPEGTDPGDVKVLFQRWHYDRSTSHLPRQVD